MARKDEEEAESLASVEGIARDLERWSRLTWPRWRALPNSATRKALFPLHSLDQLRVQDVSRNAGAAFSADGVWLISTNWDGTFNLWNQSLVQGP